MLSTAMGSVLCTTQPQEGDLRYGKLVLFSALNCLLVDDSNGYSKVILRYKGNWLCFVL